MKYSPSAALMSWTISMAFSCLIAFVSIVAIRHSYCTIQGIIVHNALGSGGERADYPDSTAGY